MSLTQRNDAPAVIVAAHTNNSNQTMVATPRGSSLTGDSPSNIITPNGIEQNLEQRKQ